MFIESVLPEELIAEVLSPVKARLTTLDMRLVNECDSPIRGQAGNREVLWYMEPTSE